VGCWESTTPFTGLACKRQARKYLPKGIPKALDAEQSVRTGLDKLN
jgi:hypothetical protein